MIDLEDIPFPIRIFIVFLFVGLAGFLYVFLKERQTPAKTIQDIYIFDKANNEVFHDRGTDVNCRRDVCTWENENHLVIYPIPTDGRAEIVNL